MKKSIVMLAAVLVMTLGLAGCATNNGDGNATNHPSGSAAPYTATPDMTPSATVPNDGLEGGGAGGTNTPNNGGAANGDHNNGTVNNGNGTVNDGNGVVGDVIDGIDDTLNGNNSRARGITPNTGVKRG